MDARGDDVRSGRLDGACLDQRRQGERGSRHVATGRRYQVGALQLVAVELRDAGHELAQELWADVLTVVPDGVQRSIPKAEVGGQVDDLPNPLAEVGHE